VKNVGYYCAIVFLAFVFLGSVISYGLVSTENFRNKARQSEAKLALSQIFQLERDFFSDKKKYTACLSDFVAARESESRRKYYVGFKSGSVNIAECDAGSSISKANDRISDFDYLPYFEKSNVTADGYTALAVGKFCEDCSIDVWSVNQKKEIVNIQSGMKTNYSWITSLISFFLIIAMVRQRNKKKQ
jgi:hypothetical protein